MTATLADERPAATDRRAGVRWLAVGASTYVFWGFFPLLLAALAAVGPVEIVRQRVLWSAGTCLVVLVVSRRARELLALVRDRRSLVVVATCGVLLGVNWGTHVVGILTGHVVDAGIGYLANPLLSVLLGVLVLRERLGALQWAGVGLAGVAVTVLGLGYGQVPWVAIVLPVSWALYGLVKKGLRVEAGAIATFTAEVLLLVPFAAPLALVAPAAAGGGAGGPAGWLRTVLLAATGVLTTVPLLLFNAAARHVSLSTLGMLQYVSAGLQVVLGVTVFAEPMPPARLAGLLLVVAAVAVFTVGAARSLRGTRDGEPDDDPRAPASGDRPATREETPCAS